MHSEKYSFAAANPALTADLPTYVHHVLSTLEEHGFEAFLVGGCVRDALLGTPVHDYDVATNARPEQVIRLFPHSVPSGLAHGTVTVLLEHQPVEVTTYRTEAAYSDGRHPDCVMYADSLYEDLERRDFTVNAVAMDRLGRVVDPMGGRFDLTRRNLRAVGQPRLRFAEDGLRIVRALRFSAQLGFTLDDETHGAMLEQAGLLRAVSMERVGQELKRIAEKNWFLVLENLADGPYLESMRTDLTPVKRALQKLSRLVRLFPELGWKRWQTHFGPRACGSDTLDPWLAATALWVSYIPDHTDVRTVLRSLAWNKSLLKGSVSTAAIVRSRPWTWSMERWFYAIYEQDMLAIRTACALCDFLNAENTRLSCQSLFQTALTRTPLRRAKDLAVDGRDLTALGLRGSEVGAAIRTLVHAVLSGKSTNNKDELIPIALKTERIIDNEN
ncbi:CCA tRNA nucleotidyltransferase [Alicyclobacillus ferrooxydans]|uniref:CCA tRNA nucleotidyltransferase n=1 Tax=Alicyclobacillus ferrooxydans TaxID=471514 RepID=UPI0006D59279|nr:CCA tRNA nucleotidyltransferase [Alicyclobacillus ferrooxydans]